MCGIIGIYNYTSQQGANKKALEEATSVLYHRGPDENGYFYDDANGVGFGHRRLSIIDLSTGKQPLYNEDNSIILVCNGEIYNFPELYDRLIASGHKFKTRSDNEAIIHLYEMYGTKCVEHLNGMFAFALWDKNKKLLMLARDRMGVKPLYYALQNNSIYFSSELKGLLALPFIKRDLNFDALNKYLSFENIPSPSSIIKNIFKLEAGKILILQNKEVKIKQYWDIPLDSPKLDISEDEAAEELERLFALSVKRRLLSDVPVGVFLSGGIDSSLVAKFMADISPEKIKTFSIGFHEKSFDESKIAMRFSKELRSEHNQFLFDSKECLNLIPNIANLVDEPISDASILPTYFLSNFASKQLKVCLGGDGGDELFAGYQIFPVHKLIGLYNLLPRELKNLILYSANKIPPRESYLSFPFILKQFLRGIGLSNEIRMFVWMGAYLDSEKQQLLKPDIKRKITANTFENITNYLSNKFISTDSDRMLYLISKIYLTDDILVKVDRASMATSLEVRAPFLDYEIQEFAAKLPYDYKLNRLTSKYILKKMAKKHIPGYIINRKKQGFAIPVTKWLKNDLKDILLNYTSKTYIENQGLFEYSFVEKIVQNHLDEKWDNKKLLWNLLVFQLWYEKYKPSIGSTSQDTLLTARI
ncbi:MAG: asparagine synthase (glutamine-hydrolyzing) [Candidatus Melainabacteria bacterium RIFCSPHIGHO2_02_FULL_34_12]|nr:MAG: asparagine synthase (glutamine-hydrolyzing) [Candidatus Melainabacteria bacterium RIFCSPHIGHO2_02_FULL_34_12]